ncbi:hypothetical protein BGO17_04170 [Candidatus Saccharibacteria bacterium 49-20]|nr:MAG: hypothetical protein BGO17_04170 [Candidatus Saccharibacteria bacterium 49-20]
MKLHLPQKATLLRKTGIFLSIAMLVVALFPTPSHAQAPSCDVEFYSMNDITFYNPCSSSSCSAVNAGGALTSPGPSSLIGKDNEEKIWNYFIARGLTPVAAAGAMGNMKQESSLFDPWAGEHGSTGSLDKSRMLTGFGLIQWTNTDGNPQGRRYGVMSYLESNGVALTPSDPSQTDKALLYELNYLWDGEYKSLTWQEQVNAEQKIEGDASKSYSEDNTGNGSAMVFHKLVERSGDGTAGKQERIDSAKEFLDKYGNGDMARGSCGVSAGGLSWEQAVAAAKKLSDNWDTIYCGAGSIKGGFYCGWTEGYCTAGAAWLMVTTSPNPGGTPGIPNGVDVANRLTSQNSDVYTSVNPDGSNIQPFSIWSLGSGGAEGQPGHTGTIVGVGEDGSIISLETNWSGAGKGATNNYLVSTNGHKVAVHQYPSFEAFKSGHNGYVYNSMATPKDASTATEMSKKFAEWLGQ